jgi:dTMP kinase
MSAGLLIALEGLDGAGTTTQASKLRDWLVRRGERVHVTAEPSQGPIGALLRLVLERRMAPPGGSAEGGARLGAPTMALLFAADRLDHLAQEILPRVAEGWIVVTDRYVLSSLAYQGVGCDLDFVASVNALARKPDLTILIDVPAAVCRRRIEAARAHLELFEGLEQQEKVGENYRALAKGPHGTAANTVVVNGDRDPEEVHVEITGIVAGLREHGGAPSRKQGA